jgi:bifunctional non-homologous end joining protein LigD
VAGLAGRISQRLCAARPDELTMEFYKKDRGERLFLDTMRNGLGATIVAAYSVRGRPGAPVSMPVEWREVEDPALAPNGFTLREVPRRLDRVGDPWAKLRAKPGSIEQAARRLDEW